MSKCPQLGVMEDPKQYNQEFHPMVLNDKDLAGSLKDNFKNYVLIYYNFKIHAVHDNLKSSIGKHMHLRGLNRLSLTKNVSALWKWQNKNWVALSRNVIHKKLNPSLNGTLPDIGMVLNYMLIIVNLNSISNFHTTCIFTLVLDVREYIETLNRFNLCIFWWNV